ncbi:MAG: hypothetical protein IKD23_02085 [Lentisphaeria bacterium]|nr:hypothetical protein [Lentisphaeria bacterium]
MRSLLFMPVLFLIGGCLFDFSDPEADRAVESLCLLRRELPVNPVSLGEMLAGQPEAEHSKIRIAFASLLLAETKKSAENILRGEQNRIYLNSLGGFLPSDKVRYSLDGTMDCPEELPPVGTVEKAALLIDDGNTPIMELLVNVRLAHLRAVNAMNNKNKNPSAENRFEYFSACVLLAQSAGVEFEQLESLEEYEKRFDSAEERLRKRKE